MKATTEAIKEVKALRTRFPWAVVNNDQVVVHVFNYRSEAKAFERTDPNNLTAFGASGVVFEEPTN